MLRVSGTGGSNTGNKTGSKETTLREVAPGSRREPRVSLVFYFREGAKIVVPGPEPLVVGRTWPADIVVDDPHKMQALGIKKRGEPA